ncbi:hypothetical protein DdX_16718 [Ditylenchus destructor]|uniref:Uncharacterized protein n=1 Tax=Ditylenchus destructor TaxID=166010 RepID=A0AAD4MP45_9BILA|nr:hypothetical protein DdX_16718 [Ditylenchus destructor]
MSIGMQQKMFLILLVGGMSYISMCRAHRYDRGYLKAACSDLIVYPFDAGNLKPEYLFVYSDEAYNFCTHELGTTVTLTCNINAVIDGAVVGYTVNKERIENLRRERALTATCSIVNGQYTWTVRGQILHYVNCVLYTPYCGPKPQDWSSEQA